MCGCHGTPHSPAPSHPRTLPRAPARPLTHTDPPFPRTLPYTLTHGTHSPTPSVRPSPPPLRRSLARSPTPSFHDGARLQLLRLFRSLPPSPFRCRACCVGLTLVQCLAMVIFTSPCMCVRSVPRLSTRPTARRQERRPRSLSARPRAPTTPATDQDPWRASPLHPPKAFLTI